jgi:hypothetical protein
MTSLTSTWLPVVVSVVSPFQLVSKSALQLVSFSLGGVIVDSEAVRPHMVIALTLDGVTPLDTCGLHCNLVRASAERVRPSARPSESSMARAMTVFMSFMPIAPVSLTALSIISSSSLCEGGSGR